MKELEEFKMKELEEFKMKELMKKLEAFKYEKLINEFEYFILLQLDTDTDKFLKELKALNERICYKSLHEDFYRIIYKGLRALCSIDALFSLLKKKLGKTKISDLTEKYRKTKEYKDIMDRIKAIKDIIFDTMDRIKAIKDIIFDTMGAEFFDPADMTDYIDNHIVFTSTREDIRKFVMCAFENTSRTSKGLVITNLDLDLGVKDD